jgi:hypothetical protein
MSSGREPCRRVSDDIAQPAPEQRKKGCYILKGLQSVSVMKLERLQWSPEAQHMLGMHNPGSTSSTAHQPPTPKMRPYKKKKSKTVPLEIL